MIANDLPANVSAFYELISLSFSRCVFIERGIRSNGAQSFSIVIGTTAR